MLQWRLSGAHPLWFIIRLNDLVSNCRSTARIRPARLPNTQDKKKGMKEVSKEGRKQERKRERTEAGKIKKARRGRKERKRRKVRKDEESKRETKGRKERNNGSSKEGKERERKEGRQRILYAAGCGSRSATGPP